MLNGKSIEFQFKNQYFANTLKNLKLITNGLLKIIISLKTIKPKYNK